MRLDVKRIINTPGGRIDFRFEEDLSDVDFGGVCPAAAPVLVEGQVSNTAGMLRVQLALGTTLQLRCDRCGRAFERDFSVTIERLLAESLENGEDDEIILLDHDTLDLSDLARETFILNMDTKTLCTEDCKGLCPGCGADLNHEPCRCKREIDPRLAKLAKLLEQE